MFFPCHKNGNPYTDDGCRLPLWEYNADDITRFVNGCQKDGVTFVATEWGAPDFTFLRQDPRVLSITLIRDPWTRLVSNYTFDMLAKTRTAI